MFKNAPQARTQREAVIEAVKRGATNKLTGAVGVRVERLN